MNKLLRLFFITCCLTTLLSAQSQSDSLVELSFAQANSRAIRVNLDDAEEVEFALKKIHTYKSVTKLVLSGEANPEVFRKLVFRLSLLKNLTELNFEHNAFIEFPDNLHLLKFLKALTIDGSTLLDYNDVCDKLKATSVSTLILLDNDIKKVPDKLTLLGNLQRLQISGSDQLDYEALFVKIKDLSRLEWLSIPFNYLADLPPTISLLTRLRVLDVSENNLVELPGQMSGLKSMNQFNIHGNLLVDPVKDIEKLKGSNIKYLSLDSDLSAEELEEIKRILPDVQIDFPPSKAIEKTEAQAPTQEEVQRAGSLVAKKEHKIYSPAYMVFASTMAVLRYNFDTLSFDERYRDLRYVNTRQKTGGRTDNNDLVFLRSKPWFAEKKGKKNETWFVIDAMWREFSRNHSELRAFAGMYWLYVGPLSKKEFEKQFVYKKVKQGSVSKYENPYRLGRKKHVIYWNDVRIGFDNNNNLFVITLKSDSGFVEFKAYPTYRNADMETVSKQFYRRYTTYQRALLTRKMQFQRLYRRNKMQYDAGYQANREATWIGLRLTMSEEERKMSKEQWLSYYDAIIANELDALGNTNLNLGYILRALNLMDYRMMSAGTNNPLLTTNLFEEGYRSVTVDFVNAKTDEKLSVVNAFVVDPKASSIRQYPGSAGFFAIPLNVKSFAGQVILVELRNGNWGIVHAEFVNAHEYINEEKYRLKTEVFDKNLDQIKDLLAELKK